MAASSAPDWNLADVFEQVADCVPERDALAHGVEGAARTWRELDRRTNALARHLARCHAPGAKLSLYAHNRPEYMEGFVGAIKARLVPVNVNYRYREDELVYLFDNSDSEVVVYEATYAARVAAIRDRLPRVREWIELEDGAPGNAFATPYEEIVAAGAERLEIARSGDDLFFLYTGGTTGMPKGVMWPQSALWRTIGGGGDVLAGERPSEDMAQQRERILDGKHAQRLLPGSPLMHGTGLFTALGAFGGGGAVFTLPSRSLDADELWRTVAARRVTHLSIVGDAFAKPMLRSLDAGASGLDLSCVKQITSSGVMWTPEVKRGLLRHLPQATLFDSFGSSEATGFGAQITTRDSDVSLAKFQLGPNCKVFTPDGREIAPGSEEPGFVARSGPIPLGYYKDEKKTAETFKVIQGRRWSIPGDWCTVNADGTLNLLGRGSVCINSGGEKIHPEEVEEALKSHTAVYDAVVVGVPDEKWGEAVTALVELRPAVRASEDELRGHVRDRLAGYKTPKRVLFVETIGRAPSGKVDYKALKAHALRALGGA
ncbi:MAG TPA: acyl-CoA synthetase [Myxococcota bacterium]|jgi:fatty-acyl-CoA synthase|nr:acyl-CoA synthetase [Myxococcota bacterium]